MQQLVERNRDLEKARAAAEEALQHRAAMEDQVDLVKARNAELSKEVKRLLLNEQQLAVQEALRQTETRAQEDISRLDLLVKEGSHKDQFTTSAGPLETGQEPL